MEKKQTTAAKNFQKKIQQSRQQQRAKKSKTVDSKMFREYDLKNGPAVAYGNLQKNKTARFANNKQGNFTMVHREFVQDLVGTDTAFVVSQYPINPGLPNLFPWLSTIATRFQKYRFKSLRFCYETSAPSTTQGYIFIVPDYDSADSVPNSKQQALEYQSAVRSNVWEPFCLDCRRTDLSALPQYYVRSGPNPAGTDIKTYDVGQIFTAMLGPAASAGPMGELWVEYDIELISPIINPDISDISDLFFVANTVQFNQGFGLSRTQIINDNFYYSISSSGRVFTFNQNWQGMLFVYAVGASGNPTGPNVSGPTTDGTCTTLIGQIASNTVYAYYYLFMNQGNYLSFDGWYNNDGSSGGLYYSFSPSLHKLWTP